MESRKAGMYEPTYGIYDEILERSERSTAVAS
jgi:hypothetical protein